MMDKFARLLEKKKGEKGELSPIERDAKMSVLDGMQKMASKSMGDKLHGLKKVSVASDSSHGLETGLDKAKEIIHGGDPAVIDDPEDKEEYGGFDGETHGDETDGIPALSDEEIDAQIAHLTSLKANRHS